MAEQDRKVILENQFNGAWNKLENELGEKFKGHTATFLRAAKVIDHTIELTLQEHDIPTEDRGHHRDQILSTGVLRFISDGPVGRSLENDPEYYIKINDLVDSTLALFKAREEFAEYKKRDK